MYLYNAACSPPNSTLDTTRLHHLPGILGLFNVKRVHSLWQTVSSIVSYSDVTEKLDYDTALGVHAYLKSSEVAAKSEIAISDRKASIKNSMSSN